MDPILPTYTVIDPSKKKIPSGVWTLVYNAGLFLIACILLFLIKFYPGYRVGLIGLVVVILMVNVHCLIRYIMYESYMESLKKKQNDNIVPSLCPDYWSKQSTKDRVVCKNEYVTPADDLGNSKVYQFGGRNAPKEYNLKDVERWNNQTKCWRVTTDRVPWTDMQMKCVNAGQF